jgi:hypothetical protein
MQKEAERQQKKLVRDNEKAKKARAAVSRAYDSQSCSSSQTSPPNHLRLVRIDIDPH